MKIKFNENNYSLQQVGKGHWYSLTRIYFTYDCKNKTLKLERFNIISRFIRSIFVVYQSSHLSEIAQSLNSKKVKNTQASDCFWEIYKKKYPTSNLGPSLEFKQLAVVEKEATPVLIKKETEQAEEISSSLDSEELIKTSVLESAGIHNNGENCSFNAFLQSVKVLPQFKQFMEQALIKKEKESEETFNLRKELQAKFLDLMQKLEKPPTIEAKEVDVLRALLAKVTKNDKLLKDAVDIEHDIMYHWLALFDYPFWQIAEYKGKKIEQPKDISLFSYTRIFHPNKNGFDNLKFKQFSPMLFLAHGPAADLERKLQITLAGENGHTNNYQLVSFCVLNGGHIVCYLKDKENSWVKFDGSSKKAFKEDELSYAPQELKMLFYASVD